jgi:hypothetical protein
MISSKFLENGPSDAPTTLILAHGAGAPMNSAFMNVIAEEVASAGIHVVRFEFPYMEERRRSGGRRAPDRERVLLQSWRDSVRAVGDPASIVIGGKSLGGRIASMIADEVGAAGLVCLGYPFHPPGNPSRTRVRHLEAISAPTLIIQGTRDAFGSPHEIAGYRLSKRIRIIWIEDGDHSLKPPGRSGRTAAQVLSEVAEQVIDFVTGLRIVVE